MDFSFFDNVTFDSDTHTYEYKGRKMPFSSTGIVGKVYPFNAKEISFQIANGYVSGRVKKLKITVDLSDTPEEEKVAKTQKALLESWRLAGDMGTRVHAVAENYMLKGEIYNGTEFATEFGLIKEFLAQQESEGFKWFRVELRVFDPLFDTKFHEEELGIAGSVDLILYNEKTKKCKIADWKRTEPKPGERGKWAIQLGIYHSILKRYIKGYDPLEFLIAQIFPPELRVHKFTVKECEDILDEKVFCPKQKIQPPVLRKPVTVDAAKSSVLGKRNEPVNVAAKPLVKDTGLRKRKI